MCILNDTIISRDEVTWTVSGDEIRVRGNNWLSALQIGSLCSKLIIVMFGKDLFFSFFYFISS